MGDVGEGAAMDQRRVAFEGLDEVREDGILQERCHGARGVELGGALTLDPFPWQPYEAGTVPSNQWPRGVYTVAGWSSNAVTVTLGGAGRAAKIVNSSGTNTVASPIVAAGDTSLETAIGNELRIAGGVSGNQDVAVNTHVVTNAGQVPSRQLRSVLQEV